MATQYSICIVPKKSNAMAVGFAANLPYASKSRISTGPYIILMSFTNGNAEKTSFRNMCQTIPSILNGQKWKPSDFNLKIINGFVLVEIKSQTLNVISRIISYHQLQAKKNFYVNLGRVSEVTNLDFCNLTKYLASLDWHLTIVKKNGPRIEWKDQWQMMSFE